MVTRIMVIAFLLVAAVLRPPHAAAGPLDLFLADIEKTQASATPARADVKVQRKEGETETQYEAVVVHRGPDVYLEVREPAVRVLIQGGTTVHQLIDGRTTRIGVQAPIEGTPFIADDVRVFQAGGLQLPQITDETNRTMLVSGAPSEDSPYVLIVYLLDREKKLVTRAQYYERVINNLVRMRKELQLVQVGNVWRPGRTEIEEYATGVSTVIESTWTANPDIPDGLFDPAKLGTVSLLKAAN